VGLKRKRHDFVELLIIDRPEAANAIDLDTAQQMSTALDELGRDREVRAVVITGAGERVFSAGMDLNAVASGMAPAINGVAGGFAGLVRRQFPHPLIAAVNGPAVGGGFEIVLACDLVVAAETASFGLPEVKRGLMAASGGLIRLAQCLPPALAFELALTGERIDARRALELGLVNRVVPTGRALDEAMVLARQIAANAPIAVRASKRLLRFGLEDADGAAWPLNEALSAEVFASEDAREGAAAFSERRHPRWAGR
jgi:enoyl-CoA hydratase/carnithine racemase